MTSSPDDRTDQVDDPETPPAKATAKRTTAGAGAAAAKKPPVKRAPTTGKPAAKSTAAKKTATAKRPATTKRPATATAARTAAKSAADKAAANAEVVIEPVTSKDATAGESEPTTTPAKKTAAAARTAAARNTAARGGATTPASPRAKAATAKPTAAKTPAKTTAAKTTAAKTTAAKTTAAKTTAARTTAARTTAAKSTAAKTAAAKAAAAKTAETKSAARTAAARTAAAKTAAAKAAAAKSAASKAAAANAAEDAETVIAPVQLPDASVETVNIEAPAEAPAPAAETASAVEVAHEEAATPAAEAAGPAVEVPVVESIIQDVHADAADDDDTAVDSAADQPREITDTGASATARVVAEVHEASDTAAISIRGLVKHFGDNHAVDGIDLTVPAGSFYGIVGPNGAGKTTTLSIVAGLLRADAGTVAICGIDQASQPLAAKRVMGVLPDRLRTFDRLTGRQLLYYYGLLRGLAPSVIEKRTADLARAFDLQEALSRVVSDYSAGMTKKLMLAGAMIHSPRVLVLDEPFESVDPVSSAVILDILRAYVSHGGTVILSSHGMDLVERVCSRVAIIVGGEVLAEGTIDEVRAGQTLEARFVELSGGIGEVEGLEWLHMFSD